MVYVVSKFNLVRACNSAIFLNSNSFHHAIRKIFPKVLGLLLRNNVC